MNQSRKKKPVVTDPLALLSTVDSLCTPDLWPGFNTRLIPLAMYTGGSTVLLRHPSPPAEFVSDPRRKGIYLYRGHHSSIRANTSVEIGGVITATIIPDDTQRRTERELAALVIHEMFHVYQRLHHPDWHGNEVELFTYPVKDIQQLALCKLETAALSRALSGRAPSGAAWAAEAVRIRSERLGRLSEGAAGYERGSELNEGLASYVEHKAAWPEDIPVLSEDRFGAEDIRIRCSVVGRAFAVLLDQLAPNWKQLLDSGHVQLLDEALRSAVERVQPASFTQAEMDDALERARLDVNAIEQHRVELRHEFRTREGWKLTIHAAEGNPLWPQAFDPSRVRKLSDSEVLHERFLKLGNDCGELEVLDRDCLTISAGAHPLFTGVSRLEITGLGNEPQVARSGRGATIRAQGVTGSFRRVDSQLSDRCIDIWLGQ